MLIFILFYLELNGESVNNTLKFFNGDDWVGSLWYSQNEMTELLKVNVELIRNLKKELHEKLFKLGYYEDSDIEVCQRGEVDVMIDSVFRKFVKGD
jgi:hypothetical protein